MSEIQKSNSIYYKCVNIIKILYAIPEVEKYLFPEGIECHMADFDPVNILWSCLRLGNPLCILFNQTKPTILLIISEVEILNGNFKNEHKKCVFHFLVACKQELNIDEENLFNISDLYVNDTNGFVKVINTIMIIIEILNQK